MPIYEYQCETCSEKAEKIVIDQVTEWVSCPKCGEPMQRVMSAPAITKVQKGNKPDPSYVVGEQDYSWRDEKKGRSITTGEEFTYEKVY